MTDPIPQQPDHPSSDATLLDADRMERESGTQSRTRLSADEWPELVRELRSLDRGGLPLPEALRQSAAQAERSGRAATYRELAEALERGESLPESLARVGLPEADALAATLEAGSITGDFWAVLSPLVESSAEVLELRREFVRQLAYPAFVLLLQTVLGAFILIYLWPRIDAGMGDLSPAWSAIGSYPLWARALAVVPFLVGGAVLWDFIQRRGAPARVPFDWLGVPPDRGFAIRRGISAWFGGLTDAFAGFARSIAWYRWAAVLSVLMRHGVPLDRGLRVAGRSTGASWLTQLSDRAAERVERGQSFDELLTSEPSSPPLVLATLNAGPAGRDTAAVLARSAEMLRESVREDAMDLGRMVSVTLIGALAVGLIGYAMLVLSPLVATFQTLAEFRP